MDYNPKTFSLRSALETYLFNKPDKIIDHISPSQLGGCHRAHYYKIKHIASTMPKNVGQLTNFEVGFLWEQIIKTALDDQQIPYSFQLPMYDVELNMSGTLDFLIGDMTSKNNVLRILDSKTQRSDWFWYRELAKKQHRFDRWESDYHYIIQQGCYLLMLERMGYTAVFDAILGYISKDDGMVGDEFSVVLNKKLRDEITRLIGEINHYLEFDQVPPCTCEGWKVGYCDYGNPNTREKNKKGKLLATECCADEPQLELWRKEYNANPLTV